jgi:hypothetical protein
MAIVVIILVAEDHDVGGVWGKLGAALVARRKPGSAPFQRDRRERAAEKGRACSNPSAVVLSTGKCAAAPVGYLETGASMGRVPNGYRDRDAETVLYLAADVSSCTVLPEKKDCFLRADLCRRGGDAIEPIESGARNQLLCTACRSESLRPIIKVSKDKGKQWRASSPW